MLDRRYNLPARVVVVIAGACGFVFAVWSAFQIIPTEGTEDAAGAGASIVIARIVQIGVGSAFCALGAFVATKARRVPGVAFLGAFLVAQGLATGYLSGLRYVTSASDPRFELAILLVNFLAYGTALRATQMFPRRISAQRLKNLSNAGRWGGVVSRLTRAVNGPTRTWAVSAAALLPVALTGSDLLFHIGQGIVIVLVIASFLASFKTGGAISRKKIYWLLAGAQFLLIGRLVIFAGTIYLEWIGASSVIVAAANSALPLQWALRLFVWTSANVGLLVCFLLAVFYSGAIHPGIVIRRTAIYSAVIGTALFIFGVFVNYVSAIVTDLIQVQQASIEAVAGAIIALLLKPINDLLASILDRISQRATRNKGVPEASEAIKEN